MERELTKEQPQLGRSARLYGHKPRSSVGWRMRQGDRLAARWTPANLGLHRHRAMPPNDEADLGFERRAMSGVRFNPAITPAPAARSMRPSQLLYASAPTPSSVAPSGVERPVVAGSGSIRVAAAIGSATGAIGSATIVASDGLPYLTTAPGGGSYAAKPELGARGCRLCL